jgi:hypothetical protein
MTLAERIQENLPYGEAVLKKLFELNSTELKAKVKEICGEKVTKYDHLFKEGDVEKITKNDEPWNITISYFDQISIDVLGITVRNEGKLNSKVLALFDKYFKYD